jgi:lysophospholipase L1-like esterase
MIGMNDSAAESNIPVADFEANLHELRERVGTWGGLTVMQTTCPILPNANPSREPNFASYMDAIRRCAADAGLPLIDHEAFWRENATQHYFWMSNAFHPNAGGHRAFAHLLLRELGIYDRSSRCCRLFFPGIETCRDQA